MFSLPFQALSMRIRIFSSVQTKTVSRRFQKLDSGDRFRKPAFLVPENADYVRTQSLFSKNIRIPVDRALEPGFKIAVLFTLLIWKKYQLKTEFQKKQKIKPTCD